MVAGFSVSLLLVLTVYSKKRTKKSNITEKMSVLLTKLQMVSNAYMIDPPVSPAKFFNPAIVSIILSGNAFHVFIWLYKNT